MTDSRSQRYQGYDQFYKQRNAADPQRLRRRHRDYAKKFASLLQGDPQRRILDLGCAATNRVRGAG